MSGRWGRLECALISSMSPGNRRGRANVGSIPKREASGDIHERENPFAGEWCDGIMWVGLTDYAVFGIFKVTCRRVNFVQREYSHDKI